MHQTSYAFIMRLEIVMARSREVILELELPASRAIFFAFLMVIFFLSPLKSAWPTALDDQDVVFVCVWWMTICGVEATSFALVRPSGGCKDKSQCVVSYLFVWLAVGVS